MSFGFDPEVPAGFQDADIELRELEDQANMVADLESAIKAYESDTGRKATVLREEYRALTGYQYKGDHT